MIKSVLRKRGALAVVAAPPAQPSWRPDPSVILGAMPVPVVLLDEQNRFSYVNHAAEQFLLAATTQNLKRLAAEQPP